MLPATDPVTAAEKKEVILYYMDGIMPSHIHMIFIKKNKLEDKAVIRWQVLLNRAW